MKLSWFFFVILACASFSMVNGQQPGRGVLDAPIPPELADEPNALHITKTVRRCGTPAPDAAHRAVLRLRMASVRVANLAAMRGAGPTDIPVCVHVIQKGEVGNVSDQRIIDQIKVLNDDYAPHGFRF